jgi:hypothetical protein
MWRAGPKATYTFGTNRTRNVLTGEFVVDRYGERVPVRIELELHVSKSKSP